MEEIDIETWQKIKNRLSGIKKNKKMKNKMLIFLYNIKMSEKTLKLKEFHTFKQRIALDLLAIDKIVVPHKFRQ